MDASPATRQLADRQASRPGRRGRVAGVRGAVRAARLPAGPPEGASGRRCAGPLPGGLPGGGRGDRPLGPEPAAASAGGFPASLATCWSTSSPGPGTSAWAAGPPASRICSSPRSPPTRRPRPSSRPSTGCGCSTGPPRKSRKSSHTTTWRAFWQTAVEGRPPAAVAAELGLSVGAVYIARSRVLARLKKRIEQLGDDASDNHGRGRPCEAH